MATTKKRCANRLQKKREKKVITWKISIDSLLGSCHADGLTEVRALHPLLSVSLVNEREGNQDINCHQPRDQ